MDYQSVKLSLEVQYLIQQKEEIANARESLILQQKQEKRIVNKKLIQDLMKAEGFKEKDLARGLNALNTLLQNTSMNLSEIFDALSENLSRNYPRESVAAEELWMYCDSLDV